MSDEEAETPLEIQRITGEFKPVQGDNLPSGETDDQVPFQPRLFATSSYYRGPIPSHEQVAGWEQTVKGSGDRILTMAEKEQADRIQCHREEAADRRRGGWFAFWFCCLCVGAAVYSAAIGHEALGIAIVGTNMAVIAVAFIVGRLGKKSKFISVDELLNTAKVPEDDS